MIFSQCQSLPRIELLESHLHLQFLSHLYQIDFNPLKKDPNITKEYFEYLIGQSLDFNNFHKLKTPDNYRIKLAKFKNPMFCPEKKGATI